MDLIPKFDREEETRMEQVAKQQKEYHLIGSTRKVRGHILFEFNRLTKEIVPAVINHTAILQPDMTGDGHHQVKYNTRVEVKPNCFYIQALNKQNAEKKLRKLGML